MSCWCGVAAWLGSDSMCLTLLHVMHLYYTILDYSAALYDISLK